MGKILFYIESADDKARILNALGSEFGGDGNVPMWEELDNTYMVEQYVIDYNDDELMFDTYEDMEKFCLGKETSVEECGGYWVTDIETSL